MSSAAEAGAGSSARDPTAHASAAMEQSDLLDLDIDELSPLPPAHGFSNDRSTSLERIPSLRLNATPRTAPTHPADSTAVASPALSAATSPFRLEASPPSSPRGHDDPKQHFQTHSQLPSLRRPDASFEQKGTASQASHQHEAEHDSQGSRQPLEPLSIPAQTPSARYVTVSAILSRSEMYYAPETSEQWDILRSPHGLPTDAQSSYDTNARPSSSYEPFSSLRRRKSQRKRPSNGSAIEALGALLLRKDSSGRVANLSFARSEIDDAKAGTSQKADMQKEKKGLGSKHGVQAWTSALGSISRNGLRLQLPQLEPSQPSNSKHGATIAERRAHMWKKVLTRQGAVVEDTRNGFSKVRSRRGGLSFEVGNAGRKQTQSTLLQLDNYRPEGTAKQRGHANGSRPDHEDAFGSYEEPGLHLDTLAGRSANGNEWSRLPETIVLKAGRRPRIKQQSKSEFGIGSAYHDQALPEAPPSPVAMPGAWHGGSSWRSKPGDGYDEGALLLPPPLLDDNGSDASSFEGLLGVRRMREREKARKQAEKLAARNRPAHKVGPLTALTNFVKAAHAAETFAKRSQIGGRSGRAPSLLRSFTEPPKTSRARSSSTESLSRIHVAASPVIASSDAPRDVTADTADTTLPALRSSLASAAVTPVTTDADARTSPAVASASPFMSPSLRRAVLSRRGSRNNSIDASGRMLNTVFEFEPLDPSQIPDDELASPDLPPISSPLLRPSSTGSGKTSAFRDFPAAPRLLPVQLSVPPSPFTPLAVDLRESRNSVGTTSANGDYLSARNVHSSPRTPQLVPTMLSLPPSPWTPYQNPAAAHAQPMIHLHLNTSTSSLRLAPGTPRLVPTHIEILPSPFPTSLSSRRGSLSYDSPHSLRAGALTRSPLTAPATDFASFAALRGSQAVDLESRQAAELKVAAAEDDKGEDNTQDALKRDPLRLTPSSMLLATQSIFISDASDISVREQNGPSHPHAATRTTFDDDQLSRRARRKSFESIRRRPSADQGAIHVDSAGRPRSFVLWFLIGDLGLRGSASSLADSGKQLDPDHGGVAALFVHTFFFLVFVAAHVVDLAYSMYDTASLLLWFLRWMLFNLTGRTVLAQCIVEAYSFIQAEWATVAIEDHEEKGSKKVFHQRGHRKPKGLSRWQVLRGLVELYCLHSVTRERYLEEGAGLKELEGWRKASKQENKGQSQKRKTRGSDRMDIGAHRAASRAALGADKEILERRHLSDVKQEIRNANLATQESNSDIRPQLRLEQLNDSEDDNGDNDNDNDNGGDDGAEDDDSSDDEMIVTNRGDDILEFAKTPRIDAARPGQASTGYFGRAYDFVTSPQVGASESGPAGPGLTTFKETNRDLVRTIKWCGRLAISAYGLHVHIVDLPPTFTPSGDRFSRQTFAYLSRLNAEDVLHADIQTLDADADYSPTFYIVRDYVRKVVCVAVRGTQSFSDIIVDLELQTEEIELPQVQPTPGEEFRCHAGIWRAAKALVSPQSKLFATLRQALEENEGFGIMFCGHSLGGAIASAAALLLAEYFIPDGAEPDAGTWVTNMSSGLPARRLIRAVSFASPVTMTADLASRAALGSVPLVTTVVLGSDVIPRVGHGQVRELRRVLGALSRVRRRHAMASTEGREDARVHILRSFWDWRSIKLAEDADDVMLHRKERIEHQLWSLRREVESDLYAAIKARLDAESSSAARIPPSPWVGPQQRDQAPLHALSARRQGLDAATLRSEAAQGGPLIPPGRCIWINDRRIYHVESPLAFFSLPELRSDMFAAHFPAAYEEAILELRT